MHGRKFVNYCFCWNSLYVAVLQIANGWASLKFWNFFVFIINVHFPELANSAATQFWNKQHSFLYPEKKQQLWSPWSSKRDKNVDISTFYLIQLFFKGRIYRIKEGGKSQKTQQYSKHLSIQYNGLKILLFYKQKPSNILSNNKESIKKKKIRKLEFLFTFLQNFTITF